MEALNNFDSRTHLILIPSENRSHCSNCGHILMGTREYLSGTCSCNRDRDSSFLWDDEDNDDRGPVDENYPKTPLNTVYDDEDDDREPNETNHSRTFLYGHTDHELGGK